MRLTRSPGRPSSRRRRSGSTRSRRTSRRRSPAAPSDGGGVDLHLMSASPTDEERGAVDELLGSPEAFDGRVVRGGHEARARRTLLLPALHALQERVGWISEGGLNYVSERLTVP